MHHGCIAYHKTTFWIFHIDVVWQIINQCAEKVMFLFALLLHLHKFIDFARDADQPDDCAVVVSQGHLCG